MQFVRKFGQGKRRFSLAGIMAKLDNTSQTAIAITFLVVNLSTWPQGFLCVFISSGQNNTCLWVENSLPLYVEEVNKGKTYIKSSLNILLLFLVCDRLFSQP